ncbi:MAG: caspase family protein, partial [Candidatus Thorarchaeota archaeon]
MPKNKRVFVSLRLLGKDIDPVAVKIMKKGIAVALLFGLTLGLLLPSIVIAVDNKMIMKGPGSGGPPSSDPADPITYYTGSAEDKWAVFIGISDYEGRSSDLWNPHNDALEMKQILEAEGYNYALALDGTATKDNFEVMLNWLIANEGPNSDVVFFYSGHGARTSDGSWDTDVEADGNDECLVSWDSRAITDSYVADKIDQMESNHIAVILASCHSGGMFDEPHENRAGVLYIAAAEADQYGWDYLDLENTLFMYWFADQGIINGPYNNFQDAFWYARPIVIAEQPDSCPIMLDNLGV